MTPLLKKLNFKNQKEIVILQHPPEFEQELTAIKGFTHVCDTLKNISKAEFILAFVQTVEEVDRMAKQFNPLLEGDGILWFAYPKKSSKKYTAEIHRDFGWTTPGELGFEGVRSVAIDEDWSAIRFRRVEYIKSMNRKPESVLSGKGKKRTE